MKRDREAFHAFLEQRLGRFRRDVAPRESGAAGSDDRVDLFVLDPAAQLRADRAHFVLHDRARAYFMSGRLDALRKQRAGFILREIARVGDGQDGERNGNERLLIGQ